MSSQPRISAVELCRAYGTPECDTYRREIFERFPLIAEDLARGYVDRAKRGSKGYVAANNWLRTLPKRLLLGPWNITHDDQALIEHARAQARAVEIALSHAYAREHRVAVFVPRTLPIITQAAPVEIRALFLFRLPGLHRTAGLRTALAVGESRCRDHQITPPPARSSIAARVSRLACSIWWRRQLRVISGRRLEQLERELGRVHKRAGIYCSNLAMLRRRNQVSRNSALLEALEAINQHGEGYSLAELSSLGLANPENRRAELMLRIRDTEAEARRIGHVGMFYTLTCPSRFHPVNSRSCSANPHYDGATPRDAQIHLTGLWARIRAKLAREDIGIYGLRVVEPHHDGTPHWHMLLWMKPEHVGTVTQVIREHALEMDGNERGAREHRFTAKHIDYTKGTAAGYVAKYISKSINGQQFVDADSYGQPMDESAPRIEAWAAVWGIRQFQFVGLPSVTVWRELRKINERSAAIRDEWEATFGYDRETVSFAHALHAAADSGQWDQFVRLMGGPMTPRTLQPARPWRINRLDETRESGIAHGRYGETVDACLGLIIKGAEYLTRFYKWTVQPRAKRDGVEVQSGAAAPWTCVNNCTRPRSTTAEGRRNVIDLLNLHGIDHDEQRRRVDGYIETTSAISALITPTPIDPATLEQQRRDYQRWATSAEVLAEREAAEDAHRLILGRHDMPGPEPRDYEEILRIYG